MLLSEIVDASSKVAATRSRREKVGAIAALLRRLQPHEIAIAVALSLRAQSRRDASASATRPSGDAREAPAASAASLTIADVDGTLTRIASVSGTGSTTERGRLLGELLGRATEPEQDFLTRLLVGELRQGALEGLMVDAIASAANVPARAVRRALMFSGDAGQVAHAALTGGEAALGRYRFQLFRPIQPMLAQVAGDVDEALQSFDDAVFEYKLDGARIQVHREGDEVRVYSREGNDVTGAVPEVVAFARALPARSVVLDGETIALRPDGTPQPFQVTMRRFGRKLDVDGAAGRAAAEAVRVRPPAPRRRGPGGRTAGGARARALRDRARLRGGAPAGHRPVRKRRRPSTRRRFAQDTRG